MSLFGMTSLQKIWDVFLLFAIPVGGGIPGGVLLAQKNGLGWIPMSGLYFISDVLLALCFEPFMKLIGYLARYSRFLRTFLEIAREATRRTIARYGEKPGFALLVGISFGVDPMTGRAAALAAGHNFVSGWAIAIIGDMIFFGMIALSTIYLNNLLGDGTWTSIIILAGMFLIPTLVQKIRKRRG